MPLIPAEIIDELATGELEERFDARQVDRAAPGSLLLDYGYGGLFRLNVTNAND